MLSSIRSNPRSMLLTRHICTSPVLLRRSVSQPLTDLLRAQINEREANRALDHGRRIGEDVGSKEASSDGSAAEPTNEEMRRYEPNIGPKGAIYSPEELSFEAKAPLRRLATLSKVVDKFKENQINPLDEYKSHNLLSEFVTDLGRIKPRTSTGLTAKNQRKMAKAIRRARALCILPATQRHPEFVSNSNGFRGPRQDFLNRS